MHTEILEARFSFSFWIMRAKVVPEFGDKCRVVGEPRCTTAGSKHGFEPVVVTRDLDEIEEKLEAHEADLEAVTVDVPTLGTAFAAQPNEMAHIGAKTNERMNMERPPACDCSNCGRQGHAAERCFRQGGGLEGHWPVTWRGGYTAGRGRGFVRPMRPPHTTHAMVVLS